MGQHCIRTAMQHVDVQMNAGLWLTLCSTLHKSQSWSGPVSWLHQVRYASCAAAGRATSMFMLSCMVHRPPSSRTTSLRNQCHQSHCSRYQDPGMMVVHVSSNIWPVCMLSRCMAWLMDLVGLSCQDACTHALFLFMAYVVAGRLHMCVPQSSLGAESGH